MLSSLRKVRGRAQQERSIVRTLTLDFYKRLFSKLEFMTSGSHDNNFTIYPKAQLQDYKQKEFKNHQHTSKI